MWMLPGLPCQCWEGAERLSENLWAAFHVRLYFGISKRAIAPPSTEGLLRMLLALFWKFPSLQVRPFLTCMADLEEFLEKGESCSTSLKEFTESQAGWGGRALWRSSKPLLEQVHREQFAQDCVQACFEYLQRKRLHSLSGQPAMGLCHPHSKAVFPCI